MTFEGEVSWTVTAKVKIRAENKNTARSMLLKNPAAYVVIADEPPTQIVEGSTKINIKQIQ
jgi:hypothetical protein